jgi:hypothetical protein
MYAPIKIFKAFLVAGFFHMLVSDSFDKTKVICSASQAYLGAYLFKHCCDSSINPLLVASTALVGEAFFLKFFVKKVTFFGYKNTDSCLHRQAEYVLSESFKGLFGFFIMSPLFDGELSLDLEGFINSLALGAAIVFGLQNSLGNFLENPSKRIGI